MTPIEQSGSHQVFAFMLTWKEQFEMSFGFTAVYEDEI